MARRRPPPCRGTARSPRQRASTPVHGCWMATAPFVILAGDAGSWRRRVSASSRPPQSGRRRAVVHECERAARRPREHPRPERCTGQVLPSLSPLVWTALGAAAYAVLAPRPWLALPAGISLAAMVMTRQGLRRELDLGAVLLPALPDAPAHRRDRLCPAGPVAPTLDRAGGGFGLRPRLDPFRIADRLGPYHRASRVSVGPRAARTTSARVPRHPSGLRRHARSHAADLRGRIEGGGGNGPAATRDDRSGSLPARASTTCTAPCARRRTADRSAKRSSAG
jgi:hypothetical protein